MGFLFPFLFGARWLTTAQKQQINSAESFDSLTSELGFYLFWFFPPDCVCDRT